MVTDIMGVVGVWGGCFQVFQASVGRSGTLGLGPREQGTQTLTFPGVKMFIYIMSKSPYVA